MLGQVPYGIVPGNVEKSRVGLFQPQDETEKGRLAASVPSYEAHPLAGTYDEGTVFEKGLQTVCFRKPCSCYHEVSRTARTFGGAPLL